MAPVVPFIPLIISAVGAAAGTYATVQGAKAQNAAFSQNQENALRALRDQQQATAAQSNQDREATAQDLLLQARAGARARASAEAQAAGSNIAGLSVDQIMQESIINTSEAAVNTAANLASRENQRSLEQQGAATTTQSRINSVERKSVSALGEALKIGIAVGGGAFSSAKGGAFGSKAQSFTTGK